MLKTNLDRFDQSLASVQYIARWRERETPRHLFRLGTTIKSQISRRPAETLDRSRETTRVGVTVRYNRGLSNNAPKSYQRYRNWIDRRREKGEPRDLEIPSEALR